MHLGHPVPQRVHDQLEHVRGPHQQRVPGARGVHVVLRVVGQPVVRGVVQAAEGERRPQVVALRRVVVHHVEDHLDARLVQRPHRLLELQDLLAPVAPGGVRVVRGEEADGVVTPVVGETRVGEAVVLDELVHRHQLDRGDAQLRQMGDDLRVREPRVRTAQPLGQAGVKHRQALDVRLVDHRAVVVRTGTAVVTPVEVRIDHDRAHRVRRRVEVVAVVRLAERVAVDRLAPLDLPGDRTRVRVEEQLRRVAPLPALRLVRAVHPEAVALPRHHPGQIGMADEGIGLAELHRRF